jgi:hypothetical protein
MSARPEHAEDAGRADAGPADADRADADRVEGGDHAEGAVRAEAARRVEQAVRVSLPLPAPAPAAAAQLLARIRTDRRAAQWVSAFERDWAKALEDSRHSYSLTPLHEVVRTWQSRLDTAPAVDAFLDSGMDDSDDIALEDVLGG